MKPEPCSVLFVPNYKRPLPAVRCDAGWPRQEAARAGGAEARFLSVRTSQDPGFLPDVAAMDSGNHCSVETTSSEKGRSCRQTVQFSCDLSREPVLGAGVRKLTVPRAAREAGSLCARLWSKPSPQLPCDTFSRTVTGVHLPIVSGSHVATAS